MMVDVFSEILKKIAGEYPPKFGQIKIRLFFHGGKFKKYEITKTEKTLVNEEA